eukprot:SAG31_NODE_2349_length_5893_cov_3.376251_2_plen_257_part_00
MLFKHDRDNKLALYDFLTHLTLTQHRIQDRSKDGDVNTRGEDIPGSLRLRGKVYLLLKDFENARCCFELELQKSTSRTDSSEAYRLLGEAYRGEGQLERALESFHTSVKEAPKEFMGYICRSRCLMDIATEDAKQDAKASAERSNLNNARSNAKERKKGKKKKTINPNAALALKDLKKATVLAPHVALCWDELGAAKKNLGVPGDDGFKELSHAVDIDPEHSGAFLNRAPLHAAAGKMSDNVPWFFGGTLRNAPAF